MESIYDLTVVGGGGNGLAAGDYANTSELITRFKMDQFSSVEGINPHSKGDGNVLAERYDARMIEKYSQWPNHISTAPKIGYAYAKDYMKLRPDIASKGNSLDEIAAKRGLPVEKLTLSVKAYKLEAMESSLPSLQSSPWMLPGPAEAYFTTTKGGAAINHKFVVLDQNDRPIPSLNVIGQKGLGG